jgi:hypothetical protein
MYPAFGWSVELRAIMDISARIDADYGDCSVERVGHGVLLVFGAPCQPG